MRNSDHQTPGEITGRDYNMSINPHYQTDGSKGIPRRGAFVLESAINEFHNRETHDCDMQRPTRTQETMSVDADNTLNSHSCVVNGVVNATVHAGSFPASYQHGAPQQQFGHNVSAAASHQTQRQQMQRSVSSAMDLMSSSPFNRQSSSANNNTMSGMFQLSSHHTSHTAQAGDLLSMSRTMDTPSSAAKEFSKKRTASYGGQSFRDTMMQGGINTYGVLKQQQQQQQQNPSAQAMWTNPYQQTNYITTSQVSIGSVSHHTSVQTPHQDTAESYENQNSKRRCCRSDSFEMMDD